MNSEKNTFAAGKDLSAKIDQSAADKLLNSITFPFTFVDVQTRPPGLLYSSDKKGEQEILLDNAKVQELLDGFAKANSIKTMKAPNDLEAKFNSEGLSNISQTIETARACLQAQQGSQTPTTTGQVFSFPDKKELQAIVDGGVEGLLKTTKGLAMKVICSELKITANNKPNLGLNGSKISIGNANFNVKATGELWAHIPSFHCSRWCTNWTVTWRWVRLASITVSVTLALDCYVEIVVNGKIVYAKAHINKLRLAYPILKEIPLEGIANSQLSNKLIQVFDAGSFVACLPLIHSKFGIESVTIPNIPNCIPIEIEIKQL
jgi:hypothetical protein